jgi:hypothetical protein
MKLLVGNQEFAFFGFDEELIRGTLEQYIPNSIKVEKVQPNLVRLESIIRANGDLLSCTSTVEQQLWDEVPACREVEYSEMAGVFMVLLRNYADPSVFDDDYEEDLPGEW